MNWLFSLWTTFEPLWPTLPPPKFSMLHCIRPTNNMKLWQRTPLPNFAPFLSSYCLDISISLMASRTSSFFTTEARRRGAWESRWGSGRSNIYWKSKMRVRKEQHLTERQDKGQEFFLLRHKLKSFNLLFLSTEMTERTASYAGWFRHSIMSGPQISPRACTEDCFFSTSACRGLSNSLFTYCTDFLLGEGCTLLGRHSLLIAEPAKHVRGWFAIPQDSHSCREDGLCPPVTRGSMALTSAMAQCGWVNNSITNQIL